MPLTQPIVPQSLVEEAFERIAQAIAAGEIEPGERLKEAQLARALGVSRAVLREALQRLESLRLVARTPNVGVHVIRPTQQDLYELYTMLEAVIGLAARLAAEHMPDDEIADLAAWLQRQAERPEADQLSNLLDPGGFHCRIAHGSRNSRLERMVCAELRYQLRSSGQHISVHPSWASAAAGERAEVLSAIERRDPARAEEAIRTYIRRWRANVSFTDLSSGGD